MKQPIYQVDAFTSRPFTGNPAAVCILSGPADESWMQSVAMEMNLSETAFLHEQEDGYSLRWFTPAAEVALCGHATLASAHILWETGLLSPEETARFHTRSGLLTARPFDEWIELDFPATPPLPAEEPPDLGPALGVQPLSIWQNRFDYLVEVGEPGAVRSLQPDFSALARLPVRGVIVTSRSDRPEYDFISRFFAPAVGVNEDPVTGSAHCCLTPFWGERLGKTEMTAFQASPRGGVVKVRQSGPRVLLCGQAITVMRADFLF
jgi:predicted PhzF superfamily epimerase YddE/YHI9